MKPVLPLFIFIDACGWEIIRNDPFLQTLAPRRKRLESVFGYSSACVPSIVSGRRPAEHRNWSYFVYDPKNSPFRNLRWLSWLPAPVTERRIFRRWLSKFVKRHLNFRGYFDLYNIPFRHISLFDFSEKRSPLRPGGMNRGQNIFDFLETRPIAYHASDPDTTEETNLLSALDDIRSERIDFAFIYWPGLDGLLHSVGNESPLVSQKLRAYEDWIAKLTDVAAKHYDETRLYVFSDHGMANCERMLDLRKTIAQLELNMPRDYTVVYDSTMARFWFFNDRARQLVRQRLEQISEGRIVPDSELEQLGAFFPDRYFGELIFLVREGTLILPSDMGKRWINGMHGYHPAEKHSYAVICTNQPEPEIRGIPEIYNLMVADATLAASRNSGARSGKPPDSDHQNESPFTIPAPGAGLQQLIARD